MPFDSKFYQASNLLKTGNDKEFAKIIIEAYMATEWVCRDYPNHCNHYFSKYIPGVFNGTREIIVCYIVARIAAVAILKKDNEEQKISTLYVNPAYRKCGLGTEILEKSFAWLGTTSPLITIADYKINQFAHYIKKYDWIETQVLPVGYYNNHSREHIFNSKVLESTP